MTRRKSKVVMSVLLMICMLLNTVSSALADGAGVVTTKNVNLNKTSYGGPMAWNGAFGIGLMYESYKDLNGVEQGKKWGRIDGIFDPKETWTVNGDIAYCFDYTVSATPESGTQHRELSSLDELGLSAAVKERALKVAKAADALTKNNYKLLKDNADGIAKAFYHEFIDVTGSTTVQLTPGTANFSKEAIASLIRNGDAKFCRWLVQWMVWTHMNQIQWGVSDAFDGPPGGTVVNPKTGETMTGQPVGALIGLGKVFDFPWMLELGYEAWLKSSSRAEYPYTFYPGESKTISGQEAEDIIGIYNKLGTIAPGYSQITVTKNADGTVTLKCPNSATPVDTDWTNWVTSEKNFAYGSTPYTTGNSSVSAQFIVKPSSYRELRSKVKVNNTYDPVDILLTKIDAETETPIADAEYTVEYFENTTATGTASKKWVFKTDSDGYIKYDDSYKVSGDALLTNPANGFPGFPANSSIKIYESKAPDKYALSDKVFKVKFLLDGGVCLAYDIDTGAAIETVLPDGTKVLNQKDEEPRDKKEVVVKKTSNGPTVEGFKFQLTGTDFSGQNVSITAVTNAQGVASFGVVAHGSYTVKEIDTPSHMSVSPDKKDITIDKSSPNPTTVEFSNTLKNGTVRVKKTVGTVSGANSNGVSLSGFTFRLTGKSTSGATINMVATTDANGIAEFTDVPYGDNYTVSEELTDAQKKYWIPAENKSVSVNGTTIGTAGYVLVEEENEPKTGSVNITKKVPTGSTSDGSGFKFIIEGTSDLGYAYYIEVVTGVGGVATVADVPLGTYSIREELTADQAAIWKSKSAETITVSAEGTPVDFTCTNDPKTTKVELKKISENGEKQGFQFTISGTRAIGGTFSKTASTDANGYINFGEVPYGSYTVKENLTEAQKKIFRDPVIDPASFTLSDTNVLVKVTATNKLGRGGLSIEKADIALDGTPQGDATLAGIRFAVIAVEDSFLTDGTAVPAESVVAVITTNAEGYAETGKSDLAMGKYLVVELRVDDVAEIGSKLVEGTSEYANDSYLWKKNEKSVTLTEYDKIKPVDGGPAYDPPVSGEGSVVKVDATNGTAQGDASFEGIRIAIVNNSNNSVVTGNDVTIAKGHVFEVITLKADGTAVSGKVPYGSYIAYELRSDAVVAVGDKWETASKGTSIYANEHGYLYKEQSQKFSIRTNNEVKTLNFSNDVVRGGVKVEKWDKELGRKVAQGDANFEGINFDIVLKSKNPVWVDGTKYEEGAVVKSITTNAAGDASTGDLDLPYGTYTIQEVATNEGYLLTDGTARTFEIRENGVIVATDTTENAIHFDNNPVRGAGAVLKRDIENTEAQGDANFEGIRFVLVNESDAPVKIGDVEVAIGGVVIVLTADKNGDMQTPERYLPYGTYGVYELRLDAQSTINVGDAWVDVDKGTSIYANEHGYLYKETNIAPIEIRKDGELVTALEKVENYVARGGVTLSKRDLYTGDTPQGDASFKGIRYAIINRSESAILLPDGKKIEVGQVAAILTTDENGNASTDVRVLPYGTYDAVELRIDDKATVGLELERGSHEMANDYYLWKDLSFEVIVREDGVVYEAKDSAGKDFENEPKEPTNPELYKYDADLGTNKAQGGATFEGIKFALINRSKLPVYVENFDRLFVVGEVIDIIESDANGVIQLGYTLPYGTYGLIELPITTLVKQGDMFDTLDDLTKFGKSKDVLGQYYANASYMYTDRTEKQFKAITLEDGSVEYDTSLLHFDNKVVRAGIYFEKKIESTQRILPYVLFKITSLDTGEAHYIFLNHNAHYGTDQIDVPHSNNTNGVDAIMAPYEGAGIVPQSVIDQLMEEEAWRWGTWFGEAPIDDNEYALPYGRYLLEEIRSDANKNFVMYFDEFTIWYNYQYRSFGTIFNKEVGLLTSAVDGATGTKEGIAEAGAKIVDTVTYNNLQKKSYTLISTLHVQGEDGKWSQIPGVEVKTEFTAEMPNYYVVVEIPFDASSYENKKVVVFEELIETISGKFVAEHKDYNDAQQTVFYKPAPKVGLSLIKDVVSTPGNGVAYMKGETVKYKITVLNTGELDLYDVDVDDDLVGFSTTIHRLKVGASKEFYTEYVVTEDDVTAEKIHNIATATCEDPTDSPSNPKDPLKAVDDETVPTMPYSPAYIHNKILYSKPGNGIAYIEGETVVYLLYAKNTGNQTLVIDITDELVKFYKTITLEPGQEWSEKVKYVVTAADVEAGKVLNVLSSKGTPTFVPPGEPTDPITPPDVEVEVPTMTWEPSYIHNKVVISTPKNGIAYTEGEVVVYELYVENDGNQPLTITVIDELVGLEEEIKLAPGESWKKQVEYTVTADDVKAGKVVNILTSSGIPPVYPPNVPEEPITPPDIEVEVPTMEENSDYKQTKVVVSTPANGEAYAEGEVVVYEIGLENTGNLPLIIDVVDELVNFE